MEQAIQPSVIIIGPAHPLRGGLASYNERLAREFQQNGWSTNIFTFSLQYPEFIFPGTTQYSTEPKPADLNIQVCINSVNPFNWWRVGRQLRKAKPDLVIVRYWLPLMGPCLGTILRSIKKNKHTKIVCIADNIVPHEKRPGDQLFTRYFVKPVDAFVTMSEKVMQDLKLVAPQKPAQFINHPLYDNFGAIVPTVEARQKLGLPINDKILLFFGFIRQYKGLDILLSAMAEEKIRNSGIKCLIAGEFYEDKQPYLDQIKTLGLDNQLILRTDFIADSEVKYYLSAADGVVQPYRNATQSGVTPLAYHFEKPMIVTNVGGLPDLVPHQQVGLVCEPNAPSIAAAMLEFFEKDPQRFVPQLQIEKKQYSWQTMMKGITGLVGL
jgi:glycosyltransferase involved in cell wall biosynthesis